MRHPTLFSRHFDFHVRAPRFRANVHLYALEVYNLLFYCGLELRSHWFKRFAEFGRKHLRRRQTDERELERTPC